MDLLDELRRGLRPAQNKLYKPLPISTSLHDSKEISRQSLRAQCESLKLPYKEHKEKNIGTPEIAVLNSLKKDGWIGTHCEGYTIKHLIKAAAFSGIYKEAKAEGLEKRHVLPQLLEAHFSITGYEVSHLRNEVFKTNSILTRHRYKKIVKSSTFDRVASPKLAMKIFKALGRESIYLLLAMYARHNYDVRAGWPDLTVVRGNHIRLIEVKKNDKLHLSQISTIPEIKKCLPEGSSIEVIRVK
jgi:hypothetical protein